LLRKILRSERLEVTLVCGVKPDSDGILLARHLGIETSLNGVQDLPGREDIPIVFDATSAQMHREHAPLLQKAGKKLVDLTPAAIGPGVVPAVNMGTHVHDQNVSLVSCGGQATIPIVAAIAAVCHVRYAEIVATIASKSAGPGTRQNIDEFTQTTARGVESIGGADLGKAIIVLNPADPPIMMRNTIYALVDEPNEAHIVESVRARVADVQRYAPGYRLKVEPYVDGDRVTTMIEVKGAGDHLAAYAGNLDIMTAAACAVGESIAAELIAA